MRIAGEIHAGFIVQNVGNSYGEGIVGSIEHILLLAILFCIVSGDAQIICGAKPFHFVISEHQTVSLFSALLQAKQCLHVLHRVLK